jgi:hypothetical protein
MRRNSWGTLAGGVALALFSPSAVGQVSSAPLAQVDSWGVGWLGANDGGLPPDYWSNTDAGTLAPLMAAIQPKDLGPAARTLLARVVLSRGRAPQGGDTLVAERLRLIEQLGETANSVDLRRRYASTDWGKAGDRLGAEFELARGETEAGCARLNGRPAADPDWMPVRALCAALRGDANAGLIAEQIVANDEAMGVWLIGALPAIATPEMKKPDGRYTTPFETAVSLAAKLPVPASAFAAMPPDVAAAVATSKAATLDQRRAALRPALEGGKLKPADILSILTAKSDAPPPKPAPRIAPKPDPLAEALATFADAEATVETKAAAYAAALKAPTTLFDARLAALALTDAIRVLPKDDRTLAYADAFTRAALLTGDTKQAADWRKHLASLPADSQDAWALARLDLMFHFAGAGGDAPGAILDRMLAAAPPPAPDATPPKTMSPAEQQFAIRRIENARILFLFAGTGRQMTGPQRALLANQRTAGRGVSDAAIARLTVAANQDADAEVALAVLNLIPGDVSAISFAGLSDLLSQLRRAGMEKDADAIALESLQVWKAL